MRLALLIALLALVAPATAAAHTGQTGGTDYRSTVTATPPGVAARMVGGDDRLEITRTSAREVVVLGYGGEPYLRLDAQGVWENRNSPAVALNSSRYAPPSTEAGGKPRWVRVSTGRSAVFHDHRAHWMGSQPPAAVREDPSQSRALSDWDVPLTVDGQAAEIRGTLDWVAPPAAWAWWLATVLAAVAAFAAGLLVRGPLGVVGMVVAVGAAIATGASQQADVPDGQQALVIGVAIAVAVGVAGLGLAYRLRAEPAHALTVLLFAALIAGGVQLLGIAADAFAYAVVPGALPAVAMRVLTMAGLAGVALVAGACVRAWRDLVRTLPAQPKASTW